MASVFVSGNETDEICYRGFEERCQKNRNTHIRYVLHLVAGEQEQQLECHTVGTHQCVRIPFKGQRNILT